MTVSYQALQKFMKAVQRRLEFQSQLNAAIQQQLKDIVRLVHMQDEQIDRLEKQLIDLTGKVNS